MLRFVSCRNKEYFNVSLSEGEIYSESIFDGLLFQVVTLTVKLTNISATLGVCGPA